MGHFGSLRNFPFFFYFFGVGYGVRFRSSDIKRGNKDKGAQQVCIRDLIGFGLSGPPALPDCQTWALCVLPCGRIALLEVAREVVRHPGMTPCARGVYVSVCIRHIFSGEYAYVCVFEACICALLRCHTHVVGLCLCFSPECLCLGVCLCVLGPEPSIILTPSGLCVGLFHQHYHLLVLYSGPQGYNDCTTIQISSSSPRARVRYLKSGSHFRSGLDSPGAV